MTRKGEVFAEEVEFHCSDFDWELLKLEFPDLLQVYPCTGPPQPHAVCQSRVGWRILGMRSGDGSRPSKAQNGPTAPK